MSANQYYYYYYYYLLLLSTATIYYYYPSSCTMITYRTSCTIPPSPAQTHTFTLRFMSHTSPYMTSVLVIDRADGGHAVTASAGEPPRACSFAAHAGNDGPGGRCWRMAESVRRPGVATCVWALLNFDPEKPPAVA